MLHIENRLLCIMTLKSKIYYYGNLYKSWHNAVLRNDRRLRFGFHISKEKYPYNYRKVAKKFLENCMFWFFLIAKSKWTPAAVSQKRSFPPYLYAPLIVRDIVCG